MLHSSHWSLLEDSGETSLSKRLQSIRFERGWFLFAGMLRSSHWSLLEESAATGAALILLHAGVAAAHY
jgi:hypothetical protein